MHKRFGRTTRLAASLAYTLQMTLYMGIVLYAPALALEALTGISKTVDILVIGEFSKFLLTVGVVFRCLISNTYADFYYLYKKI